MTGRIVRSKPAAASPYGGRPFAVDAGADICGRWQRAAEAADPLPSWNDGAAKQAILSFVEAVTREDSADFVPPAHRIATFDSDGTL